MEAIVMSVAVGILFVAGGVFSMLGAIMNWEWYFNNYKARFILDVFGRNGARIFYVILGVFLVVIGVVFPVLIISNL